MISCCVLMKMAILRTTQGTIKRTRVVSTNIRVGMEGEQSSGTAPIKNRNLANAQTTAVKPI